MIKVVDLFCGAGGLTHGLQKSGLNVVAGYDIEATCRYPYETNNNATFICKSVTELGEGELLHHYKDAQIKVLAGCAPCQPFSTYTRGKGTTGKKSKDQRWSLLNSFSKQIKWISPDVVTMENVPGLTKHKIFLDFIKMLKKNKYHVWYDVIYCPAYGMAQTRSRLVLLASKLGSIELQKPTHTPNNYVTIREVIGNLPPVKAGESHPDDPLHRASSMSELNMRRIKASKPGGTWRDWPEELRAECHRRASGKSFSAVYGRMDWDKSASTITTQCIGFGNGRFGHPEQDRAITLREAAILQSFPKDYKFWPSGIKMDTGPVAKMIGNAVPVRLGEVIGETILNHCNRFVSAT